MDNGNINHQYMADAGQLATQSLAQPIIRKKNLRNIWIDKNTTITIDLEDMKRELEQSHFPQLFEFGA